MSTYRKILKRNRRILLGTSILTVLSSFAMVYAGYSLSFFFTAFEREDNKVRALTLTFLVEAVIWLAAMGFYHLSLLAQCRAKKVIRNDIRCMVGARLTTLSNQERRGKDSGNLVSWLTNDVEQIYEQAVAPLFAGTEALAGWIFSLTALFLLSPLIGVIAIVLLGVVSVLPQMAEKHLQKANTARSAAMETAVERYKDAVMGADIFQLSNLPKQFLKRISDTSREAEQSDCSFNMTNVSIRVLISTCSLVGQVVLLFVSFLAAALGFAVPGAVLSVANLSGSFFNGVGDFTQAIAKEKAARALWSKFQKTESNTEARRDILALNEILMEDVSFAYDQYTVLSHITCQFKADGKYAIVGESGSGKSTLVKLILGLLPQYSGSIFYDALEQHQVSLRSLYDRIAYVDQQVYLFQDTLRYNITLGEPYSESEIQRVLEQCRLTELAASLPQGLDTVISENGKNFSGGQRQRIALARGLIRKVGWIILDEGTSALDESNALEIELNLMAQKHLGVILITHNLRGQVKAMLTDTFVIEKL